MIARFFLAVACLAMPLAAAGAASAAESQAAAATAVPERIAFGAHRLQEIDFYPAARGEGPRPLIVFIHGGAWVGGDKSDATGKAKIAHYPKSGYHLASVNYRLVPEVEIDEQARDVAAAIAALVDAADAMAIDTGRIVLMGHSAGAHLAALVGTDPAYLEAFDRSPSDIAGVVSIDGAALDVPKQVRDAGLLLGIAYRVAFGSDAPVQQALSPAHHVGGPDAQRFLLMHVERRDAQRQAEAFARLLEAEGVWAQVNGFAGRGMDGHNEINARLGQASYPATKVVDDWLQSVFAD